MGFLFKELLIRNSSEYRCEAYKNNYTESRYFTVYINRKLIICTALRLINQCMAIQYINVINYKAMIFSLKNKVIIYNL